MSLNSTAQPLHARKNISWVLKYAKHPERLDGRFFSRAAGRSLTGEEVIAIARAQVNGHPDGGTAV